MTSHLGVSGFDYPYVSLAETEDLDKKRETIELLGIMKAFEENPKVYRATYSNSGNMIYFKIPTMRIEWESKLKATWKLKVYKDI